ncbi:MAG: HAD-IC family P-type ATPase [Actinomycetales bacterium]|nr:HAD-IC family P-type ATPase [Actinomycetales bacterium]
MAAITGLTPEEVAERRALGQVNRLPRGTGRSFAGILRANVLTLFNGVVVGLAVLLLVLGYWPDALFGLFAVANALIGAAQEFRAKITLGRLAVLNAPRVRVRRVDAEGRDVDLELPVESVVLDDLLVLSAGDQVAADAVVIEATGLELDESLLTGEADPVASAPGGELLSGSSVVGGLGLARAVRVGADSYAARITAQTRRFSLVRSELRGALARIIRWITALLLPVGALIVNGQIQAAGGWGPAIDSGAWRDAVDRAAGSLIAMIPQGLVFMTSVALTLGAVRLVRSKVLVQELAAVEGLARVDMLCLDKTGTLTEGRLVLDTVEPVDDPAPGWETALARIAADEHANPTLVALRADFPASTGPAGARVPFSSALKWSAVELEGESAGTWVLGAPDVILVDEAHLASSRELAARGLRTLLLARTDAALDEPGTAGLVLPSGLAPVAVLALREKVRPDAPRTLAFFREEGVEVRVISGDDPRTVAVVAREAGVEFDGDGFDARRLPRDEGGLDAVMDRERVFGRVTPEQKKAMIASLQRLGHTVAMTGDGVNDALALKQADLGIALASGAPATRAVAQLVLLDDRFDRMPHILAEGRRVIANVERLAKLFLSKTAYAVLFAVVYGLVLWPYPFLPRQLSVVDGLTIGLPALVFALLPNTRPYRSGFLRRSARFCLPAGLAVGAALLAVAMGVRLLGSPEDVVQTAAVITLTISALWVLSILARPYRPVTVLVLVAAYAGLALVLAVPAATQFLRLGSPSPAVVAIAVGGGIAGSLAVELATRRARRADDG